MDFNSRDNQVLIFLVIISALFIFHQQWGCGCSCQCGCKRGPLAKGCGCCAKCVESCKGEGQCDCGCENCSC